MDKPQRSQIPGELLVEWFNEALDPITSIPVLRYDSWRAFVDAHGARTAEDVARWLTTGISKDQWPTHIVQCKLPTTDDWGMAELHLPAESHDVYARRARDLREERERQERVTADAERRSIAENRRCRKCGGTGVLDIPGLRVFICNRCQGNRIDPLFW